MYSNLKVSVNNGDGEVECLLQKIELEVHLDQPVNEDGPHFGIDFWLPLHVGWLNMVLSLKNTRKQMENITYSPHQCQTILNLSLQPPWLIRLCNMFKLTSSSRMYWYISLTYSAHSCGLSASEVSMSSMCSCCARAAVTCPTSISSGSVNFRPWWVLATTFAGSFSATGIRSASTSGCCFTACDTCVLWGQQYVMSFCWKAGRWVWKRYLGKGVCVVVVEGREKWAETAHLSSCISFN